MARVRRLTPVQAPVPDRLIAGARRRTLSTLVPMQGLGTAGFFAGYTAGALLAADLAPAAGLVGLPATAAVVGGAIASPSIARYMSSHGRRRGLVAGYLTGAAGAGVVIAGVTAGSFAVLVAGMLVLGVAGSANNLSRYVAGDVTAHDERGRAMALVVWGATAGALVGPNVLEPAGRLVEAVNLPPLAGAFAASLAAFVLAAAVIWARLRPEPLAVARILQTPQPRPEGAPVPLPDGGILRRPAVQLALASMLTSYFVMVMVMAMTPVHMRGHDHPVGMIGFVISGHLVGMFALSPVTGWLADRAGRVPVLAAGATLLTASTVMAWLSATAGIDALLAPALFVLGLGWNLGFVGGSTLLTDALPVGARARAQGTADLGAGMSAAAGSLIGGVLLGAGGYALVCGVAIAMSVALGAFVAARRNATP